MSTFGTESGHLPLRALASLVTVTLALGLLALTMCMQGPTVQDAKGTKGTACVRVYEHVHARAIADTTICLPDIHK